MIRRPRPRIALAGAFCAGLLAVAGCGDDDPPAAGPPPSAAEVFMAEASRSCSDGVQEAVALPLPADTSEIAVDAQSRAEILDRVYDGILATPRPPEQEEDVAAYLEDLKGDVALLRRIRDEAAADQDTAGLQAQVDESTGALALRLNLEDCAALANAIARTP